MVTNMSTTKKQHAKFHRNHMNIFENIIVMMSTVSKITILRNRQQKVRISVMLVLSALHMHTESTTCYHQAYFLLLLVTSSQVKVLSIQNTKILGEVPQNNVLWS